MTTEHKNDYLEKLETLINSTRATLDAEKDKVSQEELDLQAQIEALQGELLPLPGQAKSLRMAGFASKSREVTEEIESLNIRIARLEVQRAQIEADRASEVYQKFSAIMPEVVQISGDGMKAAEQAMHQARKDFEVIRTYADIEQYARGMYGQPAGEAHKRVQEAQGRLNRAIQGSQVPAAQVEPVVIHQRPMLEYIRNSDYRKEQVS